MLVFFSFHIRKKVYLIYLLPLFFFVFSVNKSYSQKDSTFVYHKQGNIITELLFSSSGFSGKDTNGQKKYYYGIGIYSKIGYAVIDKINTGIMADYFFSKSNVVQTPPFYQFGAYARWNFFLKPKISFFIETSYSFSNACYLKDTFNVVVSTPKFKYFSPGTGVNFRFFNHLFGTISFEKLFSISHSACNRNGYAIKLGMNYYFKP